MKEIHLTQNLLINAALIPIIKKTLRFGFFKAGLRIHINFIRIRIQHFRLSTNPDPDPIRIQGFNDQKLKKNYSMSKLQKKPAAHKKNHPTLQNLNFKIFLLLLWVIFALLDPDPDSGSGFNRVSGTGFVPGSGFGTRIH
jgi:hypothetical protein